MSPVSLALMRWCVASLCVASLVLAVSGVCTSPKVRCPATPRFAQVPTPWFNLTFSTDPTAKVGGTIRYGYVPVDLSERCPYTHTGIIQFDRTTAVGNSNGSDHRYVDLNAATGQNSVGVSLQPLPYIGSASAGVVSKGSSGWSFEITFKATLQTSWGKVFCIGNGAGINDILIGFHGGSLQIDFDVDDGTAQQGPFLLVTDPPGLNVSAWYHMVGVVETVDSSASVGNYYVYVNGKLQPALSVQQSQGLIPAVNRSRAYLGRSCYDSDAMFNGYLDTFRIYDVALNAAQVNSLYYLGMGGCSGVVFTENPTVTNNAPNTLPYLGKAPTPYFSLTAASDPRPANALYGWRLQDTGDVACGINAQHKGLIVFNGGLTDNPATGIVAQYETANFVNLSTATGPNSAGKVLGVVGGPSAGFVSSGGAGWSFEFTFKAGQQGGYSKLMDLGSTRTDPYTCVNDIVFGWNDGTNAFGIDVCDALGHQFGGNVFATVITPGSWYHVVWVSQQTDATDTSIADWYLYVNGKLVDVYSQAYGIQAAVRQNAFLGASGWPDPQWSGLLDTFNVYNVALSGVAIGKLATTALGSSGVVACTAPYNRSIIQSDATFFSADFTDNLSTAHATYKWLQFDPSDNAADQSAHRGLIQLNGSNPTQQYVDLALGSGDASAASPPISREWGGLGTGSIADGTMGWSIEVSFKPFHQSQWAKLYDFSENDGQGGSWDVLFGYTSTNNYYDVDAFDGSNQYKIDPSGPGNTTVPVVYNRWYHHVWVMRYDSDASFVNQNYPQATYTVYTNNVVTGSGSGLLLPRYISRQYAFLGRSSYNDSAWDGDVDFFRLYSVALNPLQVGALYRASRGQ